MTFNQLIEKLQELKNQGKTNTDEYQLILALATKANPNRAPVGFYLD